MSTSNNNGGYSIVKFELPEIVRIDGEELIGVLENICGHDVYRVYLNGVPQNSSETGRPLCIALSSNGHDHVTPDVFTYYLNRKKSIPYIFYYVFDGGDAILCRRSYSKRVMKDYLQLYNLPVEEENTGIHEHMEWYRERHT